MGTVLPLHAQVSFEGTLKTPVKVDTDASSGLQGVYVLSDAAGVEVAFSCANPSGVQWSRYSNLGGGYAEAIPSRVDGARSVITLSGEDMGYIATEADGRQTAFWVVNYSNHTCTLRSLSPSHESDCSMAALQFQGSAGQIKYFTINGVMRTLPRGLTLEYSTLTFDEEKRQWTPVYTTESLEYIAPSGEIHAPAPLCSTEFLLTGDRFQIAWGEGKTIQSPTVDAIAVDAVTQAVQSSRTVDNEIRGADAAGGEGGNSLTLGGSAPVEITFEAYVTDAAIYREWQFGSDPSFDVIDIRVADLVAQRTFTEYGTVFARFLCGNDDNSCNYTSPTYVINIGESRLECPNAFSPGSSEGSNDEWKVSYKSIVEFDCHIFNRWGIEVAHLTSPDQGWDGRHGGKLVKSGVFYYVITARGADGKVYNLSGDINILRATYNPQ